MVWDLRDVRGKIGDVECICELTLTRFLEIGQHSREGGHGGCEGNETVEVALEEISSSIST